MVVVGGGGGGVGGGGGTLGVGTVVVVLPWGVFLAVKDRALGVGFGGLGGGWAWGVRLAAFDEFSPVFSLFHKLARVDVR